MYFRNCSVFYQCCFRNGTEMLMAYCSFWIFFPGIINRQATSYFNELEVYFHFIFIGVASALMGRGGKIIHGVRGTPIMGWEIYPLGQTLICVVTGLIRSMNHNMLRKIYKKRILTLQEKALFCR